MGKLQPVFSWQKYEGKPEEQTEQFQYQLQRQHIITANSINTTIDDLTYFTTARVTGFAWINGHPIWTKTLTGTIVGSAITAYPIGVMISSLVSLSGTAQNSIPMTTRGLPLPFINTAGNNIGIYSDTVNVYVDAADGTWNGYTFYITIKYTV
jgi:hypothetical protein